MEENQLRDRAYKNAVAHGWHETDLPDTHWLMMIVTEIAEAVQADRHDRHADKVNYTRCINSALVEHHLSGRNYDNYMIDTFDEYIKDTVEDEIADIFIRCYDFAGLRNYDIDKLYEERKDVGFKYSRYAIKLFNKPFTSVMFSFVFKITLTNTGSAYDLCSFMYQLAEYCGYKGIDLLWHINEKMKYNELREYKHGCRY